MATTKIVVSRPATAILRAIASTKGIDAKGLVESKACKDTATVTSYVGSLKPHASGVLTHEYWDTVARDVSDTRWSSVSLLGRGFVKATKATHDGRARRVWVFTVTSKGTKYLASLAS